MDFYLKLTFLLVLFAFFDFFRVSVANKVTFFIVSVVLIFVSGFRYGLETDYWSYWRIFHGTSTIQNVEIGYEFISAVIRNFTDNFNYFLVCIAILSLGVKSKVLAKNAYPFVALLIVFLRYFVFFELNGMRQGLATAFIMVSLYALYRKKTIMAFCAMIVAATIHVSSLAFLLAFFMKNIAWTRKKLVAGVALLIVFRLYLLVPLIDTFSFLAGTGSDFVVKGTKYLLQSTVPSMSGMAISVMRILLPALCIYTLGLTERNKFFFNVFLIGAFFNIAFLGMDTISYRIAMVFYASEGIAMSQSIRKQDIKTMVAIVVVILLNLISFYGGLSNSENAIPYRNYLFENPATVRT